MKLLDTRGYVYDVYDLGNGRVLKKEKAVADQYSQHALYGNSADYVDEHKERARHLAAVLLDKELIGNPMYEEGESYTQDKAIILEDYIQTHTLSENKLIIDSYIRSIFDSWQNGFADIIFNFSHNNGVSTNGRVIQIDFNEVTFLKSDVAERIHIQRWLLAFSYTKYLPEGDLKVYYAEAMAKAMTLENLEKYWKDNAELLEKTQ
jgi:hypothetical protein